MGCWELITQLSSRPGLLQEVFHHVMFMRRLKLFVRIPSALHTYIADLSHANLVLTF